MDKKTLIRELRKYSGIGEKMAEKLAENYYHIDDIKKLTTKQLQRELGNQPGKNAFLALRGKLYKQPKPPKTNKKPEAPQSKYTTEVGESIAEYWAKGEATKLEICNIHGISTGTFDNWRKTILEFYELLKRADEERKEQLNHLSDIGMKKLLTGYTVQEKVTETLIDDTGQVIKEVKGQKVVERHIPPSATMIVFVKANVSDGKFRHVQHITYEPKDNDEVYDLSQLSSEELEQFKQLTQKITKKSLG